MTTAPLLDSETIDLRGRRMLSGLLADVQREAVDALGSLLVRHLVDPFGRDLVVYLADLQQATLVPYPRDDGSAARPLVIDGTVAGRCFRHCAPQRGGRLAPLADVDLRDVGAGSDAPATIWWPLLDGSERMGVLGVELDPRYAEHPAVLTWLAQLADTAATLLMSSQRASDAVTRIRRTRPMDVAAEMQWALLPPLAFEDAHVSVSGALEPAYSVAGDVFDFSVDDGTTRFAVLDAVGHGLESSVLASLAVSAYRNARRNGLGLVDTVAVIEAVLARSQVEDGYVTGLLAELDTRTGRLSWLSAGHESPLVLREGGRAHRLHAPARHPFGLGLGSQEWIVSSEQLEPGDRVLAVTDGVTDARSPEGEFFGEARLVDHVGRHVGSGLLPAEIMRRIVQALLTHQQGRLQDDATLLLVRWKPSARSDRAAP